ncbi:MAG TPA: hybrid sensor histidine kinase/response regulator, partial [Actinomycetota bacterium]|nr:hybrid sensor histidine kinase/response regulator [Actinomycetota bacterium]
PDPPAQAESRESTEAAAEEAASEERVEEAAPEEPVAASTSASGETDDARPLTHHAAGADEDDAPTEPTSTASGESVAKLGVAQSFPGSAPATIPEQIAAEQVATAEPSVRRPAASSGTGGTAGGWARGTVRIATSKLDGLMAHVGELLVSTTGLDDRRLELRSLLDSLAAWADEWERLRPGLDRVEEFLEDVREHPSGRDGEDVARLRQVDALAVFLREGEGKLANVVARLSELERELGRTDRRTRQVTSELQNEVLRVRMLPVSALFDSLPRMVRDLARDLGKEAGVVVRGADTEVDRAVLEQMRGPLTHLVRNALDHGLESPEDRRRSGKPRGGTISITASQRGGALIVEINDDGAGIDAARVRAVAVEKGVLTSDAARAMTDREAISLIFGSGLSTSPTVTDVSGRGVGLDVVRESVERLQGSIEVDSRLGEGTTFSLTLPVSVATTQSLLVRSGGQTFAIPLPSVSRILRIAPEHLATAQGRSVVSIEGEPVMVTPLAGVLGLDREEPNGGSMRAAVLLRSGNRSVALTVDELLGSQDLVVKNLPAPLLRVRGLGGATILGSGDVVIVVNVADLVKSAAGSGRGGAKDSPDRSTPRSSASSSRVVLVADDSVVSRMLQKGILETAGYQVRVAADGMEAWELLLAEACDLLVSDVNMPRMDGLELTAKLRSDARFRDFPVILVTSLDSAQDHARGVEAGADAYIVKSAFSRDGLLQAVQRLI